VLKLSASTGIDRFPLISKKVAVGLVNVFDVLLDQSGADDLRHYTRRILSADETESAYRIIRRLRAARLTLAAVNGAGGKLIGIVTIEDLVRRLVQSA
jgi:CBS domain containing-hemolysin-like protein